MVSPEYSSEIELIQVNPRGDKVVVSIRLSADRSVDVTLSKGSAERLIKSLQAALDQRDPNRSLS